MLQIWRSIETYFLNHVVPVAPRLLVALLVFVLGRVLARMLVRGLVRGMDRSRLDVSLRKFVSDVAYAILLMVVVTAALDTLGVETTAVVAVLGAAGLAIGLALQGSLSNFAAGVMILLMRPYKVGDHVVIGKYAGRVEAIRVVHTVLITDDNREITIPNGRIVTDPIENMTALGSRRVDIAVTVAHGSNLHDVRQRLTELLVADARVATQPAPTVELAEIDATAVHLRLRPWASVEDYPAVKRDLVERVKDLMDAQALPFTVHTPAS